MLSTGLDWLDTIIVVGCLGSLVWLAIEWTRKRHEPFRILGEACLAVAGLAAVGPFFREIPVPALLVAGTLTVGGSVLMLVHYRTQREVLRKRMEARKKRAGLIWTMPLLLVLGTVGVMSYLEGDSLQDALQFGGFALPTVAGALLAGKVLLDRFTGLSERPIRPPLLLASGLLIAGFAFPFDTKEGGTRAMLIVAGGLVLVGSTWLGGGWYLRRRLAVEMGSVPSNSEGDSDAGR